MKKEFFFTLLKRSLNIRKSNFNTQILERSMFMSLHAKINLVLTNYFLNKKFLRIQSQITAEQTNKLLKHF